MKKKKKTGIYFWIAVFLWMLAVFCFSAQTGEESSRLSSAVVGALQGSGGTQSDVLTVFIRKSAHFLEYLLLGSLLFGAFSQTFRVKILRLAVAASTAGILYAVIDEGHQAFVPGRNAQFSDVALDGAGAICGVSAALLLWWLWQKRKRL